MKLTLGNTEIFGQLCSPSIMAEDNCNTHTSPISLRKDLTERIAVITINRPKSLNSLTRQMMVELARVFKVCANSEDTGAIILTGAGTSFCAGVVKFFKKIESFKFLQVLPSRT